MPKRLTERLRSTATPAPSSAAAPVVFTPVVDEANRRTDKARLNFLRAKKRAAAKLLRGPAAK